MTKNELYGLAFSVLYLDMCDRMDGGLYDAIDDDIYKTYGIKIKEVGEYLNSKGISVCYYEGYDLSLEQVTMAVDDVLKARGFCCEKCNKCEHRKRNHEAEDA